MPTEFEMEHGTKNAIAVIDAYFELYPDEDPCDEDYWDNVE